MTLPLCCICLPVRGSRLDFYVTQYSHPLEAFYGESALPDLDPPKSSAQRRGTSIQKIHTSAFDNNSLPQLDCTERRLVFIISCVPPVTFTPICHRIHLSWLFPFLHPPDYVCTV